MNRCMYEHMCNKCIKEHRHVPVVLFDYVFVYVTHAHAFVCMYTNLCVCMYEHV
jgi:hypothetical protein